MKFKKTIILTIIILFIFSLFTSAVYADFSGSFSQGFANGLKIGTKIKQMKNIKWQKKQIKEIDEELERLLEQWKTFSGIVENNVESGKVSPESGKKLLVLHYLLLIELQEHRLNLFNGAKSIDKDEVSEEKQYFENVIETISLSGERINSKTLSNLSNLLSNDKKVLMGTIIKSGFSTTASQNKLKYNSFESKWEYAPSSSSLKLNPHENKWEFAMPDEKPKYNAFESKWEFASPKDKTKYNPFENKWSYEDSNSSLKYNAFESKWEYAPSGSSLKFNPFADSWSYE